MTNSSNNTKLRSVLNRPRIDFTLQIIVDGVNFTIDLCNCTTYAMVDGDTQTNFASETNDPYELYFRIAFLEFTVMVDRVAVNCAWGMDDEHHVIFEDDIYAGKTFYVQYTSIGSSVMIQTSIYNGREA